MAFKLDRELSEKQIEADVATYFGWVTPVGKNAPFRLLDVDEQVTGADKMFDQVIPIYMQFKVSEGLTKLTNNIFSTPFTFPFHLTPLKRISVFRKRVSLYDNPTLYFKLRAMAKTATDFQHNILLKLANTGISHSFYVAPLTLSRDDYKQNLFSSTDRFLDYPFYVGDNMEIHQERWSSHFGFVPFLRAHISIVPHERVATDNHYYSFSPNGTDIAWHSPKQLSNSASRLSDMLKRIFASAFANRKSWTSPREFISFISDFKEFDFIKPLNENNNDNYGIEQLVDFGRELYNRHEIRQLLLLTKTEYLIELEKYNNR